MTVFWIDGTVGAYSGIICPTGRVEGTTYDKRNPGSKARWHSIDRLPCLATAAAEPAAPEKPVKKLGKKPKPATVPIVPIIILPDDTAADTSADPTACKEDFVWRKASPQDFVCVTKKSRARVAKENKHADDRVDPDGASGPNTCIEGFVWRDAFDGDAVCVSPEARDRVHEENSLGPSRRVGG